MNPLPKNEELKKGLRELQGAIPDPEAFDATWEQIQLVQKGKVIPIPYLRLAAACGLLLIAANAWIIGTESTNETQQENTSEQIYTDLTLYTS